MVLTVVLMILHGRDMCINLMHAPSASAVAKAAVTGCSAASCACDLTDIIHCAAGYVEQFDTMLPELSVREMLLYTAELKCVRFCTCPHHLY